MKTVAERQRDFFKTGITLDVDYRISQLKLLQKALDQYDERIMEALFADLGKSSFEAVMSETGMVRDELKLFLKNIKKWNKERKIGTPVTLKSGYSKIYREPYGVSLIISPWNYPVQLTLVPLIASIAAGNCTMLKVSEFSEHTSSILQEMLSSIYPSEYVKVVQGDAEVGEALLKEKFDYIFFTGNQNIGKIVMKAAANNLTPVTLELGGKSPCIIDKSADIKLTARQIIWGKSLNAGQTCVAPDYLLVHEKIKPALITALKEEAERIYGEHSAIHPDFPKIISQRHFDRATKLISNPKVIYGGLVSHKALKIDLTIMDNVNWTDRCMQEEIFAPILPVLTYSNIDETIDILKEKDKPLALYIFSQDSSIDDKIIHNISFGSGAINDTIVHITNHNAPFGGVGTSGMGRYHGKYSFDTFSREKYVYKKIGLIDSKLRYFPKENKEKLLRFWFYR